MKTVQIKSFKHYLEYTESLESLGNTILLFRGQTTDKPLLPSVVRANPNFNTIEVETKMLNEFRRRSYLLLNKQIDSDWDLMVYAQHFGLKTRLLDWSSNPLVALWFACENEYMFNATSYVYILEGDESLLVSNDLKETPFNIKRTKILRPVLNSDRILAQSGWFTAHKYSTKFKKFVKLETNDELKKSITQLIIPYVLSYKL